MPKREGQLNSALILSGFDDSLILDGPSCWRGFTASGALRRGAKTRENASPPGRKCPRAPTSPHRVTTASQDHTTPRRLQRETRQSVPKCPAYVWLAAMDLYQGAATSVVILEMSGYQQPHQQEQQQQQQQHHQSTHTNDQP
ncbi:hypothetical protein DL768_003864 [Monosporascus sp. mg162]|nr:hypothetical protein DL768_003864 [Monosporascus sp. mg162]